MARTALSRRIDCFSSPEETSHTFKKPSSPVIWCIQNKKSTDIVSPTWPPLKSNVPAGDKQTVLTGSLPTGNSCLDRKYRSSCCCEVLRDSAAMYPKSGWILVVMSGLRGQRSIFGNQKTFRLFFWPSTRCFSHLAYNSYLLINPTELCSRFLVDYSATWRRNFKHHPSFREYCESLVTSNIMSFRRRIPARGNDLLAAFSCEALLKDFHTT